jgi:hypothetical protein
MAAVIDRRYRRFAEVSIGASFMLFARRTALAIVAGVLFLILNGFITLAFGCSSIFR